MVVCGGTEAADLRPVRGVAESLVRGNGCMTGPPGMPLGPEEGL
jgi:hypothetical protein